MSQPLPKRGQLDVVPLVLADFRAREQQGIATYGTTLQTFNGRDALQDLYEELMDACLYIKQVIEERKEMTK